jgi:DNA-binding protein HU-beta
MNRQALIRAIYYDTDIPQSDIARVLDCLQCYLIHSLVRGIPVSIQGFGRFYLHYSPSRVGRNFRTGDKIQIPESRTVRFRPGSQLRQYLRLPPGTPLFNEDW